MALDAFKQQFYFILGSEYHIYCALMIFTLNPDIKLLLGGLQVFVYSMKVLGDLYEIFGQILL